MRARTWSGPELRGDPDTELDRQLADLGRLLGLVRAVNDESGPHKNTGS